MSFFRGVILRIERFRLHASEALAQDDGTGVLRHLILGQKVAGLASVPWRELGFVHVLTSTGIHLAALASGIAMIVRLFTSRSSQIPRLKRAAELVSIGVWGLVWLLCGARAGMLRPGLLLLIQRGGAVKGTRFRRGAALFFALLIDGLFSFLFPAIDERFESFSWGRLHYALAVLGGVVGWALSESVPRSPWRGFHRHFAMALGSWLFVVPLEVWETQLVAPLTPVLSLLTIPFLAQGVLPLGLLLLALGELDGLRWMARATTLALEFLVARVRELDALWVISVPAFSVGAALLCGVLLLRYRGCSPRRSVAAGFLVAVFLRFAFSTNAAEALEQWNVRQGDAAWIRDERGESWLFDLGSARAMRPAQWLRQFAARDVTELRGVLVSHQDEDHVGGLQVLSRWMRIDEVVARSEIWEFLRVPDEIRRISAAQFSPPPGWRLLLPKASRARNGTMLGLVVIRPSWIYVNLGDSSRELERSLARELHSLPALPWIWKLSHHGSRTSTPEEWFREFAVREVWISSGGGNSYGHPHAQVLRMIPPGVRVRRTDLEGTLSLLR